MKFIITKETIFVCGGVTTLLLVVSGFVGLIVGLCIMLLVVYSNWKVKLYSTEEEYQQ